jgi:predicted dehydrogenase
MSHTLNQLTRRQFLKTSAAGAALGLLSARSWAQVAGANQDIRVAVVGLGRRGSDAYENYLKLPGVRLVALCDVDSAHLEKAIREVKDKGADVRGFTDYRKLVEDKEVDAVSLSTPNHWHSLGAIWAVQNGKDVYVEKPVSHNVWEGRQLVNAARQHKRIVQAGMQCRSSLAGLQRAVQYVNSGKLGKIRLARGFCYKSRGSIGKVTGPQTPPATLDYDLWCGPAEKLPLLRKDLHYDWHWVWNTGNGDLGNQGIHEMDVARWFLGVMELSPRILAVGGRLGYVDDGETPNTMVIYHDYPGAPLIFEVRGLPEKTGSKNMDKYKGAGIGIVIECEGGHVTVPSYSSATAYDKEGKVIKEWKGGSGHHENWLKAVRSRKHEDLHADILEGHLSSALCHTGNISYRLGAAKSPGEIKEGIRADAGLAEAFDRMTEHLAVNGVDIAQEKVTLGLPLKMDPKTERFIGNAAAEAMLTRPYRAPFIVPASA